MAARGGNGLFPWPRCRTGLELSIRRSRCFFNPSPSRVSPADHEFLPCLLHRPREGVFLCVLCACAPSSARGGGRGESALSDDRCRVGSEGRGPCRGLPEGGHGGIRDPQKRAGSAGSHWGASRARPGGDTRVTDGSTAGVCALCTLQNSLRALP